MSCPIQLFKAKERTWLHYEGTWENSQKYWKHVSEYSVTLWRLLGTTVMFHKCLSMCYWTCFQDVPKTEQMSPTQVFNYVRQYPNCLWGDLWLTCLICTGRTPVALLNTLTPTGWCGAGGSGLGL
jgi:hypothetical protein